MYKVTREIHFCYGHRLLNYDGKCRHLHGRYVALVPALQDVLAAVRKVIVPQLARAPRRTPVKMGLGGVEAGRRVRTPRRIASDR